MLVGYESNNPLRDSHQHGDFSRELIARIADRHINGYRAMLFTKNVKRAYRTFFSGNSNVSTYVPTGLSRLLPSLWLRFSLNSIIKTEQVKVKLYHGLNSELPYGLDRDIKTVITYYGLSNHNKNSLMDRLLWRTRLHYAFRASNRIIAVDEKARVELLDAGVPEDKIVVIGVEGHPFEVTDQLADAYYEVYRDLVGD